MRNYLIDFFEEFGYAPEDGQVLLGVYDRIMEEADAAALWQKALRLYEADPMCDYGQILSLANQVADRLELHSYTLQLLIFICMTPQMVRYYEQQGLDLEIYKSTVLDLRYKLEECKAVYGIVGSFVAAWFAGFFSLERFALGRLQFEIVKFKENYEKNGIVLTPETDVINVHIPRTGTPFDPQSCDEAFALAKAFYRDRVGDPAPFVCHSWLLYPENEKILSEKSNTYHFLKRFDILHFSYDRHSEELWRLFDTKETNPDRLPADTSFRRRYVEHLKKGGRVGSGYGVFIL